MIDTAGRSLPPAVVAGAGRVLSGLRAGDLDALRGLYTPDRAAGVVGWSTIAPKLEDPQLRADLAAALSNPPQPRPEVAYLFSFRNRGIGMSEAGTVVFFGTGAPRGSSTSGPSTPGSGSGGAADAGPTPLLGAVWGPYQKGYGQARPPEINGGGDPTGVVTNVVWKSWGGPEATAAGQGSWQPPNGTVSDSVPAAVLITASDLGDCRGHLAYRKVSWYFPTHGETAATASAGFSNICEG